MAANWLLAATTSRLIARLYKKGGVPVEVVTASWAIGIMAGPISIGCSSLDRFLVAKQLIILHTHHKLRTVGY